MENTNPKVISGSIMKKILHIASFTGNIGDNANHLGFEYALKKVHSQKLNFTRIEIRRMYENYNYDDKLSFDDEFIEIINSFDLLVIGGGNFFELWLERSATGTTINLSETQLQKIKIPILFNALGVDSYKGYSENTLSKFKEFISYCTNRRNTYLSIRNDGSYNQLINLFGEEFANSFKRVADYGFFVNFIDFPNRTDLVGANKSIGININKDMIEHRFPVGLENISYQEYLSILSKFLVEKLDENFDLIFIPHIYSDLAAISEFISKLGPKYSRIPNIKVAPLLMGDNGIRKALSIYNNCEFILGMRFHTNVCCLSLNKPIIPLATYKKIQDLYSEIDLKESIARANSKLFESDLKIISKSIFSLDTTSLIKKLQTNNLEFLQNIRF